LDYNNPKRDAVLGAVAAPRVSSAHGADSEEG
jgi:hypothetical protein